MTRQLLPVSPIDLARLCSIITHHPHELLGLRDFLKLSEDDNRTGEVLTPIPPWFVDAMSILSDQSIDFLASEWAQAEDICLFFAGHAHDRQRVAIALYEAVQLQ